MKNLLLAGAVAPSSRLARLGSMRGSDACRKPAFPFVSGDTLAGKTAASHSYAPYRPFPPILSPGSQFRSALGIGTQAISLRPLGDGDSLDELTAMLHRSFSRLAQMGLNCTGVDQSAAVTRKRIEEGVCFVAVCETRLVGTITLHRPDPGSLSAWYHRQAVASMHQFAVDPEFQGKGLGGELLNFAESWARERGYRELALETPQPAKHLVEFYVGRGYRPVESVRFQDKRYRSVVLSKSVAEQGIANAHLPPLLFSRRSASSDPAGSAAANCRLRLSRFDRLRTPAGIACRAGFSLFFPRLRRNPGGWTTTSRRERQNE